MQEKNILAVLDELGAMIIKHKNDIKYKDIEIESLRKKIERVEQYANFYSENTVEKDEYCKAMK